MQKCQQTENDSKFPPFYAPSGYLDTDTPLTPSSFETAKSYCGWVGEEGPVNHFRRAAIHAVNLLLSSSLQQRSLHLSEPIQTPKKQSQKDISETDLYTSLSSTQHTPSHPSSLFEGQEKDQIENSEEISSRSSLIPEAIFVLGRPPGHHAGPDGSVASLLFFTHIDVSPRHIFGSVLICLLLDFAS